MLSAVIFLLTVFISGSHQQCFSNDDTPPALDHYDYRSWVRSQRDFSLSLFKFLNKGTGNVIFSPSSVFDALLLAYFGAAHQTEASIHKALSKSTYLGREMYWRSFRNEKLIYSPEEMGSFPIKTANKIFFSDKLRIRPCIKKYFGNEIELIDYKTDPLWAVKYINDWVSDKTEGEINNALSSLSEYTTATIVNAVFFKGKWKNQFNPNNTQYLKFRLNSKRTKPAKMMVNTGQFFVADAPEMDARLLKMIYGEGRIAMIIALPNKDLNRMIAAMNTSALENILDGDRFAETSNIKVIIPKFEHRNRFDLNAAMKNLGFGDVINENADFSRFTGKDDVYFNQVLQEAVIKVNEEGTTAAAVTFITEALSLKQPSEPFICDRPFAYFIYDYFTSKIIFMGTFRDPERQ